jgi:hypothetical protein
MQAQSTQAISIPTEHYVRLATTERSIENATEVFCVDPRLHYICRCYFPPALHSVDFDSVLSDGVLPW